jgi:hypothetical protein
MQEVVVFLHVPKCGGTTVRNVFHRSHRWAMTSWSTSPPQITATVLGWLRKNVSRIFVEHHMDISWWFPAHLKSRVLAAMPAVRFCSFALLRSPDALALSSWGYWSGAHNVSASEYSRVHSEQLLFEHFKLTPPRVKAEDVCTQEPWAATCAAWRAYAARPQRRSHAGQDAVNPVTAAEAELVEMAQRAWATEQNCSLYVEKALRLASRVDTLLFLNDGTSMERIAAVAFGETLNCTGMGSPQIRPRNTNHRPSYRRLYTDRAMWNSSLRAAAEVNRCSMDLYRRLVVSAHATRSEGLCNHQACGAQSAAS